jgi:predicted transcriptional regulator
MAKSFSKLGEFEILVLRLVWQHQPCTERQISDLVQEQRSVRRTTVLKTMQRMEAKGLLSRVPDESPILFRAVQDENRMVSAIVGRFVERVLGGSPGPLLTYFADSGKLSEKDLKTLRAMAQKIAPTPEQK